MSYETVLAAAQCYWPCQEASGNLVDVGTEGSDLTPVGSPGYQATGPTAWLPYAVSIPGGSVCFKADSPAGRVTIPFTIAGWVYPDDSAFNFDTLLARRDSSTYEWSARLANPGLPSILCTNGSIVTVTMNVMPVAQWHFFAWVVESTGVSFYKDGGNFEVISGSPSVTPADVTLRLGAVSDTGTNPLTGDAAGVGIWNSALSKADLDALYAGPTSGPAVPVFLHHYQQQGQ